MTHLRKNDSLDVTVDANDSARKGENGADDNATVLIGGPEPPSPATIDGGKPSPSAPALEDQTNFLPTRQVITVFLGLSVAMSCSFLDQTIVATALPKISSDLHSGRESSWIATAYLLTSLAFTPLYGRWSDVFGRKPVLLFSLVFFLIFSLACALSKTMIQLIVFRAFQGIGGGAIITMVFIIVSDIVSLKDRGKYQGIQEGTIAVSNGIGPILGGVFSQYTTWRWCFYINLPMAGLAILVAVLLLPLKGVTGNMMEKLKKIDYVGSFLTILSSILVLIALTWGGVTYPWASAQVLVPLFLGVLVAAGFVVWEAKFAVLPIIPVHIFRHKTVTGVYICTLTNGMTFFAILYYVPQFLQLVRGSSPIYSSVLMLPFLAPVALVVFLNGVFIARTGHYRYNIIIGYVLWSIAQGLQSTIDQYSSTGRIVGTLLMGGLSAGFTFQTTLIAAQACVSRQEMAVVTGVRNFVRLLGSTISLAICASIIGNKLRNALNPLNLNSDVISNILNDPTIINSANSGFSQEVKATAIHGYLLGFKGVFYLTIACQVVAFFAALLLIEQHELSRAGDADLKQAAKEKFKREKAAKEAKADVEAHNEKEGYDAEAE
ncbi:MFS general substrate transporter [Neolentinus lepideus HHB14362 ss-1]|uniref:MFS general substrate transporter n=1 Tax=Neolentinus lepideus HHB14362 ss-1 TaxID=1314782 RepID=A0A165RER0_9AGAM|nr:MFS general substrate transporter [Neolentinus lepideus HHB14362 ss-1]